MSDSPGDPGLSSDPFEVQVEKWVAKAQDRALAAFQATAWDALARVKQLTPVDTGYLRSNWVVLRPGDTLPVAGQITDPMETIRKLQLGDKIVLANPVVYARRVEFGFTGTDSLGRHYDQKGRHMMAQTIAEMPRIARAAAARVVYDSEMA